MGAVQFIENMDRTTLTITDDEFERNVEAAVSAIAEKHRPHTPPAAQETQLSEKGEMLQPPSEPSARRSLESGEPSTPRRSTSSNDGAGAESGAEEPAVVGSLLRSIQRPLTTIGRIFSDEAVASSSGSRTPARTDSPRQSIEPTKDQRPISRQQVQQQPPSAEEAAARQASAETAEAQRLHRAEHANIVETLASMFPDLDKEIISDVVYQKEGR
jgi:Rab5 GDP/GTP exchange factor